MHGQDVEFEFRKREIDEKIKRLDRRLGKNEEAEEKQD